jgi:hypothetical protein
MRGLVDEREPDRRPGDAIVVQDLDRSGARPRAVPSALAGRTIVIRVNG